MNHAGPEPMAAPANLGESLRAGAMVTPMSLGWLCLQGLVFLSPVVALGGWGEDPWFLTLLSAALLVWLGYAMVRNAARLWRAPAVEARVGHVVAEFVMGAFFLLFAIGPLLESELWSKRLLGGAWAALGLMLLALGVRELRRVRSMRRAVQQ